MVGKYDSNHTEDSSNQKPAPAQATQQGEICFVWSPWQNINFKGNLRYLHEENKVRNIKSYRYFRSYNKYFYLIFLRQTLL